MPLPIPESTQTKHVNQFFKAFNKTYNQPKKKLAKIQNNQFKELIEVLNNFDVNKFTTFDDEEYYADMPDLVGHKAFSQLIDFEIINFDQSFANDSNYQFIFLKSQLTEINQLIAPLAKKMNLFCSYNEFTDRGLPSNWPMSFISTIFNISLSIEPQADSSQIPAYTTTLEVLNQINKPQFIQEITNQSDNLSYSPNETPLINQLSQDIANELKLDQASKTPSIMPALSLLIQYLYRISHNIDFVTEKES